MVDLVSSAAEDSTLLWIFLGWALAVGIAIGILVCRWSTLLLPWRIDENDEEGKGVIQGSSIPEVMERGKRAGEIIRRRIREKSAPVYEKPLRPEYASVFTLPDVFTRDECAWIIYESEKYAMQHQWTTNRHANYPTTDNCVVDISSIRALVFQRTYKQILPFLETKFGVDAEIPLAIHDLFVVKYSMDGQRELAYHEDASEFSFIVSLNDDFTEGGTEYKRQPGTIVKPPVGSVAVFSGQNTHRGVKIASGIRYIIAGFITFDGNRRLG
jgi:hypothetical protein